MQVLVPLDLQLVEPGLYRSHRLRAQPEHSGASVASGSLVGSNASVEEHAQVTTHRGRRDPGSSSQLPRAAGAGSQQFDHNPARRIGQGIKDLIDRCSSLLCHGLIVIEIGNYCNSRE